MNAKMSAPIKSISLNERTYHGVTITPSLINFFFGKNGAGKTTISDTIRKMIPEYPEYDILIYDREFIAKNIKEDEALPGVFSVNEEDIEKQNQIDEWQKQLHELGLQYSEKKSAYDSKKGMPEVLRANLMNSCWKHTQTMRSDFIHTMDGKRRSKSAFLDELLKVRTAKEADLEALKNLYDTAYSSDSTRYPRLQTVKAPDEKNMPGFSLLDTAYNQQLY